MGIWALVAHEVEEVDIVEALCRRDEDCFAMGLTAARLLGFPVPSTLNEQVVIAPARPRRVLGSVVRRPEGRRVDARIHLATFAGTRHGTALVRWSRSGAEQFQMRSRPAVRLTSRVRTLLDLAGLLDEDDLVAIGDHLVRRPRAVFEGRDEPFMTVEELRDEAAAFHGRGARTLRSAVAKVRVGSDSPAETRLRLALMAAGLPEPQANVRASASVPGGGQAIDLGEPDLHWPVWRVALEHEGPSHLGPEQLRKDIARGERRSRAGWIEVRTTSEDLERGCRRAVARVRDALQRQGWDPGSPQ